MLDSIQHDSHKSWEAAPLLRKFMVGLALAVLVGLGWAGFQYWSITRAGESAAPGQADVIIVLGAAVWPQGPSPALQARIYHAYQLYRAGYAHRFILSGGMGAHPPTEAEAMYLALLELGVDPGVMYLEPRSTSTWQNLAYSKAIMDEHSWGSALIVTDPFHIKRALLVARDLGIRAYGGAAKNSVLYQNRDLRTYYTLREVLALAAYHLHRGRQVQGPCSGVDERSPGKPHNPPCSR